MHALFRAVLHEPAPGRHSSRQTVGSVVARFSSQFLPLTAFVSCTCTQLCLTPPEVRQKYAARRDETHGGRWGDIGHGRTGSEAYRRALPSTLCTGRMLCARRVRRRTGSSAATRAMSESVAAQTCQLPWPIELMTFSQLLGSRWVLTEPLGAGVQKGSGGCSRDARGRVACVQIELRPCVRISHAASLSHKTETSFEQNERTEATPEYGFTAISSVHGPTATRRGQSRLETSRQCWSIVLSGGAASCWCEVTPCSSIFTRIKDCAKTVYMTTAHRSYTLVHDTL